VPPEPPVPQGIPCKDNAGKVLLSVSVGFTGPWSRPRVISQWQRIENIAMFRSGHSSDYWQR
jgi:hypothetical protein